MSKIGIPNSDPGKFESQNTIISAVFGSQCSFVGDNAFENCISLLEINENNIIESIGSTAFAGTKISSATFNKLTYMGYGAFNGCSNLKNIHIPNCEYVSNEAFKNCVSLDNIDISNATYIKNLAFNGCTNLTHISVPNCSMIEQSAFKDCSNLKSIYNDEVEVKIGINSFENCSQLKTINFNKCTEIGSQAFKNCSSLDKVNINNCTKIGTEAFIGCTNITQVSLSMCSEIGSSAFVNCPKLEKVYVYNTEPFCKLANKNVFCTDVSSPCSIKTVFYFTPKELEKYKQNTNWSHYINNMVMMVENNQIIYTTNDNVKINTSSELSSLIKEHEYFTSYGLIEFKEALISLNQQIFKNSKTLSNIDIPSNCEHIGDNEFEGCTNLHNIELSNTLKSIGEYAFKDCISFTTFTIPESVTDLSEGIFSGCLNIEKFKGNFVTYDGRAIVCNGKLICVLPINDSITEGRIHDISTIDTSINHLGKSCFQGCVNMRRVNIPSNIVSIGDNAFEGCSNLCEIHFEGNIPPTLGKNVFKDVRDIWGGDFKIFVPEESLSYYCEEWAESGYISHIYPKAKDNSIIYYSIDNNKLSTIDDSGQTYVDIPYANGKYYKISNVDTSLPTHYFSGQKSITKVILGDGISKISKEAFKECENMEYIYLSDSIDELNDKCFYRCSSLKRVHIPSGLTMKKDISNDSNSYSRIANPTLDTSLEISLNSITFGYNIFEGCKKLKEFGSYYKGYVSDDNRCFIKNSSLMFFAYADISEYTIPDNIIEINRSAFYYTDIKHITLKDTVKTIGESAFEACYSLESINDWDSVETISKRAFNTCPKLGKISLPKKLKTIGELAFLGCKQMYINTNIPDTVESIGKFAFNKCENFKYIPDGSTEQEAISLNNIVNIKQDTFSECSSLTKVNIGNKVGTIGYNAFSKCTNLIEVSIPIISVLSQINDGAFYNCENLTNLNLPESLVYIGDSAFENCTNYKGNCIETDYGIKFYNLSIPPYVNSMGQNCFKKTGIESLFITSKSGLGTIPSGAFCECENLKYVDMYDAKNIKSIGSQAFMNCKNLSEGPQDEGVLSLPNSVTIIDDYAFSGCDKIMSVTLPEKLTSLGDMCLATGYVSSIYVPMNLSTPPKFTIDLKGNEDSNPFGDMSNYGNIPSIYISRYPTSLINTYKINPYWSKYSGKMYTY